MFACSAAAGAGSSPANANGATSGRFGTGYACCAVFCRVTRKVFLEYLFSNRISLVLRIFYATSDWQSFDVALKKNQEIWTENQFPTEWSSSIVNETLDKIVTKEKVTAKPPQNEQHLKKVKS